MSDLFVGNGLAVAFYPRRPFVQGLLGEGLKSVGRLSCRLCGLKLSKIFFKDKTTLQPRKCLYRLLSTFTTHSRTFSPSVMSSNTSAF